ncbi:predicted protein [Sclerotinia sclerotiorum 1980 UF-70]|uniref:Uncharacterized protein n=1 Tax=Sclerotinia sclerotiorum (strain ATCC 18683 / 1980 / Ss-1) TaxID=665079 RepID=A7EMJ3_SCLS1|nr:predicted protein [Sclerotinia sclerotiorum 1980 UF-70]EDO04059.1 predicted protein [Sclerotinia sclerotiorum 1980 UF-70]
MTIASVRESLFLQTVRRRRIISALYSISVYGTKVTSRMEGLYVYCGGMGTEGIANGGQSAITDTQRLATKDHRPHIIVWSNKCSIY